MQMANLTITTGLEVRDVCFTAIEHVMFIDSVNKAMAQALYAGLLLGFLAGAAGIFAAFKYIQWKKEKEWEDYGKD